MGANKSLKRSWILCHRIQRWASEQMYKCGYFKANIPPSASPWTLIHTYRKSAVAAAPPRHDRASSHVQTKAGPWLRTRCPDSAKQPREDVVVFPHIVSGQQARGDVQSSSQQQSTPLRKNTAIFPHHIEHTASCMREKSDYCTRKIKHDVWGSPE